MLPTASDRGEDRGDEASRSHQINKRIKAPHRLSQYLAAHVASDTTIASCIHRTITYAVARFCAILPIPVQV